MAKEDKEKSLARRGAMPAMMDDMERMMEQMWERMPWRGWMRPWMPGMRETASGGFRMPNVDVLDRDKEIVVRAEVPGVEKDDLDVSIHDSSLTIRGHSRREDEEEKGTYYRHEVSYGEFLRTLQLPTEVDAEQVKAKFKNGILEVTLPKVEGAKGRSIEIEES